MVPQLVDEVDDRAYESMVAIGLETAARCELASSGDRVVVTAGVPFGVAGSTNTLKVEAIP